MKKHLFERDESQTGGVYGSRDARALGERKGYIIKAYIGAGGRHGQILSPGEEIHTQHSWRTLAEEIKESHFCIAVKIASVNRNSFGAICILCKSSIRLKRVTKRRVSILYPFAFERSIGSSLKIRCRMYPNRTSGFVKMKGVRSGKHFGP